MKGQCFFYTLGEQKQKWTTMADSLSPIIKMHLCRRKVSLEQQLTKTENAPQWAESLSELKHEEGKILNWWWTLEGGWRLHWRTAKPLEKQRQQGTLGSEHRGNKTRISSWAERASNWLRGEDLERSARAGVLN